MKNFITEILSKSYTEEDSQSIFKNSYLLQYLNNKTNSVDKSSKSRGSFANLYAIYVLVEDYISKGYMDSEKDYSKYIGMIFTEALSRTRSLPFGDKIQNHALNNRCNDEFRKFFISSTNNVPIIRNLDTKRYWINEKLLLISHNDMVVNIAPICKEIVEKYIELKMKNFNTFFKELSDQKDILEKDTNSVIEYLSNLLNPNSDARIFEIISFVIIKYFYITKTFTYSIDNGPTKDCPLTVFKTGRTNANDGGIDYIMQPLGRIFQVTEVLDFKKYFLDIDKLIHYPITFVVKQSLTPVEALEKIKKDAQNIYSDENILNHYLSCFEEIITIPTLTSMLSQNIKNGFLTQMIDELIVQCKVEYNIE